MFGITLTFRTAKNPVTLIKTCHNDSKMLLHQLPQKLKQSMQSTSEIQGPKEDGALSE